MQYKEAILVYATLLKAESGQVSLVVIFFVFLAVYFSGFNVGIVLLTGDISFCCWITRISGCVQARSPLKQKYLKFA